MTGTAATESTEFESIYKLKVTIVPTNKPMIRKVNFACHLPVTIFQLMLVFWKDGVMKRKFTAQKMLI